MLRMSHWDVPGKHRIYISDLPGTTGQVYVELVRGDVRIMAAPGKGELLQSPTKLLEFLYGYAGVPIGAMGQLFFEAIKAKCGTPKARAATPVTKGNFPQYTPVAERLFGADTAFENIVNELEVVIEVDHREPEEIDAWLRRAGNTKVIRGHLPVGDYRINDTILVERKSAVDFAQSVQSSHIFDQAQRIGLVEGSVGIVLIEGDIYGMNPGMYVTAITGAITCLQSVQGMSVFQTLDLKHTAYALASIARNSRNGLGYELATRKDKPTQLLHAQHYVLEGISGVSPALAGKLLVHFGSIRDLAAADEKALREVDGVGPKTAKTIVEVLSGQYAAPARPAKKKVK